jgi:hypothetical protein
MLLDWASHDGGKFQKTRDDACELIAARRRRQGRLRELGELIVRVTLRSAPLRNRRISTL